MAKFLPIREERLSQIKDETQKDETMQALCDVIINGWPESKDHLPAQLSDYWSFKEEFSVQDGLVFRGERVVIPTALKKTMVDKIHSAHLGVEACLRRARECMYWPRMCDDIRRCVSVCEVCRTVEVSQQKETLMSSEVPECPWQKVGSDLFVYDNTSYLVTVDYYSDYFELDQLTSTSAPNNTSADLEYQNNLCPIKTLSTHLVTLHSLPRSMILNILQAAPTTAKQMAK